MFHFVARAQCASRDSTRSRFASFLIFIWHLTVQWTLSVSLSLPSMNVHYGAACALLWCDAKRICQFLCLHSYRNDYCASFTFSTGANSLLSFNICCDYGKVAKIGIKWGGEEREAGSVKLTSCDEQRFSELFSVSFTFVSLVFPFGLHFVLP